jgi:hypothetical protein
MSNVSRFPVGDGRTIHVNVDPFGEGYFVSVRPISTCACYSRVAPTLAEALSFARGLRVLFGWPIIDQTVSETPKGAA